jgi:uncharacterized membrane protein
MILFQKNTKILYLLFALILVMGIFFRFINIDKKVYWGDETYTSLRVSGYKWAEYSQIFDGKEYSIEDIQKYQRINPETDLTDTLESLAVEDPHHPPLYYILGRFWVQWFGNSVAVRRSLSALISLLVFPCTYWLCLELFQSPLTGGIATVLMAVSPFHLLYAQEVREFSLWTVTILLSSAALLRAMRRQTKLSWGIYSITLALGFYTFLFSILVGIGHGIYVFIIEKFRLNKRFFAYSVASIAGLILFSPWLFVVIDNLSRIQTTNADKTARVPFAYLIKTWTLNLTRIFFDVQLDYHDPFNVQFGYDDSLTYFILATVILVGYAIYFLCRHTLREVWLFILTLIGVTALALMLPDVIIGGTRSINARYLIPCYLGIQLAVAYLLANKVFATFVKFQQRKFWQLVMVILISGSVLSCVLISQAETWWSKYSDYYDAQIAHIVNEVERPLVIIDNPWRVLPLSYSLDSNVRLQVTPDPDSVPTISEGFSDIFIYNSYRGRSEQFRETIKNYYGSQLELVYKAELTFKNREISLWKLNKQ